MTLKLKGKLVLSVLMMTIVTTGCGSSSNYRDKLDEVVKAHTE